MNGTSLAENLGNTEIMISLLYVNFVIQDYMKEMITAKKLSGREQSFQGLEVLGRFYKKSPPD